MSIADANSPINCLVATPEPCECQSSARHEELEVVLALLDIDMSDISVESRWSVIPLRGPRWCYDLWWFTDFSFGRMQWQKVTLLSWKYTRCWTWHLIACQYFVKITLKKITLSRFHPSYPLPFLEIEDLEENKPKNDPTKCPPPKKNQVAFPKASV